jgi:hypothetical protein
MGRGGNRLVRPSAPPEDQARIGKPWAPPRDIAWVDDRSQVEIKHQEKLFKLTQRGLRLTKPKKDRP